MSAPDRKATGNAPARKCRYAANVFYWHCRARASTGPHPVLRLTTWP